jgi:hypothetical protein
MVLILGKLGDACRKLCELEILFVTQPTNKLLSREIEGFRTAVDNWPLINPENGFAHVRAQLRISLERLRHYESEVKAHHVSNALEMLSMSVGDYLHTLQVCRDIVATLNALGSVGLLSADQDIPTQVGQSNERISYSQSIHEQRDSSLAASASEELEVVSLSQHSDS